MILTTEALWERIAPALGLVGASDRVTAARLILRAGEPVKVIVELVADERLAAASWPDVAPEQVTLIDYAAYERGEEAAP